MTVLIDTSVWIEHFRTPRDGLVRLVSSGEARLHPFVIGELAIGSIRDRSRFLAFLSTLSTLPAAAPVADADVLAFIEDQALHGTGVGLVDVHLLASCTAGGARLWTFDKRLKAQAERLGLAFTE